MQDTWKNMFLTTSIVYKEVATLEKQTKMVLFKKEKSGKKNILKSAIHLFDIVEK